MPPQSANQPHPVESFELELLKIDGKNRKVEKLFLEAVFAFILKNTEPRHGKRYLHRRDYRSVMGRKLALNREQSMNLLKILEAEGYGIENSNKGIFIDKRVENG